MTDVLVCNGAVIFCVLYTTILPNIAFDSAYFINFIQQFWTPSSLVTMPNY